MVYCCDIIAFLQLRDCIIMKQKGEISVDVLHEKDKLNTKKIRTNTYLPPIHVTDLEEDDEAVLIHKKSRTEAYEDSLLPVHFDIPDNVNNASIMDDFLEDDETLLIEKARLSSFPIGSDLRFISVRDKYRQIKYDVGNKNITSYEDALSNALWGIKLSETNDSLLFRKTKKSPQAICNLTVPPVSIKIKKTIKTNAMIDDYYASPINWSLNGNVYMGLGDVLYSYKPSAQIWKQLTNRPNQYLGPVHALCATSANVLYSRYDIANKIGNLSIMDTPTCKVTILQKVPFDVIDKDASNANVFYAGGIDGCFSGLDIRLKTPTVHIAKIEGGSGICGMSVSEEMIATGDDGDRVHIWDIKNLHSPVLSYTHKAAVKALAFSPFNKAILASGGGTQDKTIQIWDINKKEQICEQETDGQLTSLHWIDKNTVLTTGVEGQVSNLQVWKIKQKELKLAGSLPKEDGRMLFSTQNPKNPYQFFTGTGKKHLQLVEVEHEQMHSIFSCHMNGIR